MEIIGFDLTLVNFIRLFERKGRAIIKRSLLQWFGYHVESELKEIMTKYLFSVQGWKNILFRQVILVQVFIKKRT